MLRYTYIACLVYILLEEINTQKSPKALSVVFEVSAVTRYVRRYVVRQRRSRNGSVGTVTNYGIGDWAPLIHFSVWVLRPVPMLTQPPRKCIPETLSRGLKRSGREADDSNPYDVEVRNERPCISISLITLGSIEGKLFQPSIPSSWKHKFLVY
jgi:hypothetical protein